MGSKIVRSPTTVTTTSGVALLPKQPSDIKVVFEYDALQKIKEWTKCTVKEISGMLLVDHVGNTFTVLDVFLLKQTNTAGYTDIDDEALGKLVYDLAIKDKEDNGTRCAQLRGWWHSHANMGTFWSGTDNECIDSKIDDRGPEWWLSIETNRNGVLRARLDIKQPRMMIDELQWSVKEHIPTELKEFCKKEYDEKVTQQTYNWPNCHGGYDHDYDIYDYRSRDTRLLPQSYNEVLHQYRDVILTASEHFQGELGHADELDFTDIAGIAVWDSILYRWEIWGDFMYPGQQAIVCNNRTSFITSTIDAIYRCSSRGTQILMRQRVELNATKPYPAILRWGKVPSITHDRIAILLTQMRTGILEKLEQTDQAIYSKVLEEVTAYANATSESILTQRINGWLKSMATDDLKSIISSMYEINDKLQKSKVRATANYADLLRIIRLMLAADPIGVFVVTWEQMSPDWYCANCMEPVFQETAVTCPHCKQQLTQTLESTLEDAEVEVEVIADDSTEESDDAGQEQEISQAN